MESIIKDNKDPEDLGNFKLPINRKMSIAILKIPQPMIIIGNQISSKSNCTCKGNGTCNYCLNNRNGVHTNNNSSLIKLDSLNKSDLFVKKKKANKRNKISRIKRLTKNRKLTKIKKLKLKLKFKSKLKHKHNIININSIDKQIQNNSNTIIQNQLSNIVENVTQLSNNIINNNQLSNNILHSKDSNTNCLNLDTSIITTNKNDKPLSDNNQIQLQSQKNDKSVDTCDIDNFNILDHLNEVESLLNIERKRRFNEIRRDYSILRDRIEEKFHLVISSCNQRLLHLNSSYLNALSSIQSNLSSLKLPKLNHIKHQLDLL